MENVDRRMTRREPEWLVGASEVGSRLPRPPRLSSQIHFFLLLAPSFPLVLSFIDATRKPPHSWFCSSALPTSRAVLDAVHQRSYLPPTVRGQHPGLEASSFRRSFVCETLPK